MKALAEKWRRALWQLVVLFWMSPLPTSAAPSEPASTWKPGHRTTDTLPGEVTVAPTQFTSDGVYGRFEGDLALALALGAEVEARSWRGLAHVSAHYYWSAGLYATHREAFGSAREELAARRITSFGIDLRPLFLPRWSLNWQKGPAVLDLCLDSISISSGAFFAAVPTHRRAERRGFELGLGAGVPLLAQAQGPWLALRYSRRWPEAGEADASLWLSIAWHLFANTPLAATTGAID